MWKLAKRISTTYSKCQLMSELTQPYMFYVSDCCEPFLVKTLVHGRIETENWVFRGDYVLSGCRNELYVVKSNQIPDLFDMLHGGIMLVRHDDILHVRQANESGMLDTGWGSMMVERGDYIIKDGRGNLHGVEKYIFHETYILL